MSLGFLDYDEHVRYITHSLTEPERAKRPDHGFYQRGKRPVLLIIDMQRGYVSPEPKPWIKAASPEIQVAADRAVVSTERLIKTARKHGIPIVYTGTRYLPDGSDCGIRAEKFPYLKEYMREGLPWPQIDPRLEPRPGEPVVWKKVASGFFATYLIPVLIQRGVDTCIITGTATSGCVRAAAVDAVSANFRTVVVEEAVCDKNLWAHKATLFDLWRYIATVATEMDVINWMESLQAEQAPLSTR